MVTYIDSQKFCHIKKFVDFNLVGAIIEVGNDPINACNSLRIG